MNKPASSTQPPPSSRPRLSRQLGLFELVMMGVGMMIGAGAILGMGESVHIAGAGGTLLAFLLSGLVALITAMAYGEMSSAVPKAGSIYQYTRLAFGKRSGFMAGWISWFAAVLAGSLYAGLSGIYLVEYVPFLAEIPLPPLIKERVIAVLIVLLLANFNYRGVEDTGRVQTLLTVCQTLVLSLIAVAGIAALMHEPDRISNFSPLLPRGWIAIPACMGFEFVAFEGFEVIASAGEEALHPRRNLPRAMILSVAIVTVTYLAVAAGLIAAIPHSDAPA
jgi:amino acid transporter